MRIQKAERVVGDDVGDITRFPVHFAIPDERSAVISGTAHGMGFPEGESLLRVMGITQMPFTAEPADVTIGCEDIGIGDLASEVFNQDAAPIRFDCCIPGAEPVVDAMLRGDTAGEERGPGRRAHGRSAEEVIKPEARTGKAVKVRCANLAVPRAPHGPRALIIGQDD